MRKRRVTIKQGQRTNTYLKFYSSLICAIHVNLEENK